MQVRFRKLMMVRKGTGFGARVKVSRAWFAGGVSSLVQTKKIGWNVRNCPKRSFAVGAVNGDNWIDSGHARTGAKRKFFSASTLKYPVSLNIFSYEHWPTAHPKTS